MSLGRKLSSIAALTDYMSTPTVFYGLVLTAVILQVVSLFLPYYSNSTGNYGIFKVDDSITNECLGAPSSGDIDECAANKTFPILAAVLGLLALISMGASDTAFWFADLGYVRGMEGFKQFFNGLEGWNIGACFFILTATIMSVTAFGFQMGHPLEDGVRQNVATKVEKDPDTKYEPAMAISATAMTLFIIAGILVSGVMGNNIKSIDENCGTLLGRKMLDTFNL